MRVVLYSFSLFIIIYFYFFRNTENQLFSSQSTYIYSLDGELEDPTEMPDLPKVLAVDNFRNAILEKYCARIGAEMPLHPLQFARHETDIDTASTMSAPSIASSRPSRVSSSFRFIGDYANPTEVIRRTPDFDSVILLLHEVFV